VAAISFPELPGPPVVPGPPSATERDESSPAPHGGVPVRDRFLGVGVVLVLFAILAATAGWRVVRDDSSTVAASGQVETPDSSGSTSSTTPSPDEWPAEVLPLVTFVEQHRGGKFDHPVPITYLTKDEYEAEAQAESASTTPQDQADLDTFEGQLRALGLLDPSIDVQNATEQMYGSGTLAFYDSETNEVKVLGTDLDVAHRVTLVHELTHAWQDQHGYLDKLDELDDPQAYTLQAVAEGDATRIENEYIDTLSSRERDAYDRQSQQQGADADLSGVPDALIASFSSLYALGGPFAGLLDEEGGNTKVNAALADPPPSEADIVDPNRYLDGVQPVDVAEPSVPAGAERIDGGTFGAVSWLITLSEHIDPRDALDVVDTWAGDQSVTYRQDGRVCTAAAFKGLTSSDTAAAASRIGEWAAAMGGHDASVSQTDGTAVLRSCESSGATDVVGRSQVAVGYPAVRLEAMVEALKSGATLEQATCFGNAIAHAITPDQMEQGAAYDPDQAATIGAAASKACLN
jgi:hypothetical protein